MLGLRILIHSVKLVFLNWKAALRISSPFVLLLLVFNLVLRNMQFDFVKDGQNFPWGMAILGATAYLVVILWVAVAWHRYVLLEEDNGSLLPAFSGRRIGAYLLQGFLLFIIMIILMVIVGVVSSFLALPFSGIGALVLVPLVSSSIILWVFYRYSPVLPAAALDQVLSIDGAWNKTKPYKAAILVLVLGMSVLSVLTSALLGALELQATAQQILSFVQVWISTLVSISVLTTIYGVTVENREL